MSEFEYVLALDLGMSRIAAATSRLAPSGEVEAESFVLGHGAGGIAAVAFATENGDLLFGDAAEQRGFACPDRLVRGFIRRIGDPVPLMIGGRRMTAEELTGRHVRWVLKQAALREGAPPAAVTITHPSTWTSHRVDALEAALVEAGIPDPVLLPSPAAAAHGAPGALSQGDNVAVYDLGGSSFECTVLRRGSDGDLAVLGEPATLTDLGGSLFDHAVLRHALDSAGIAVRSLPRDPETRIALARLRRAATAAKEALSYDADATIPVTVGSRPSTVRLTRSELEAMIDPALERTLDALEQSIQTAVRAPDQVDVILVVGGGAHIPLVAQRLSERFDRPLVCGTDGTVALGAARVEMQRRQRLSLAAADGAAAAVSAAAPAPVERPRRRSIFGVLRPALSAASTRPAAPAAIAVAAVVVAAAVAVNAAGAWARPEAGDVSATMMSSSEATGTVEYTQVGASDGGTAALTPPAPEIAVPPGSPTDRELSAAQRRPAREAADDASSETPPRQSTTRSGPTAENPSPAPAQPGTAPVSTPAQPPSTVPPSAVQPPSAPAETPPEDQGTPPGDQPTPVEQPAEDPPPAEPQPDEPPPTDPAPPAEPPAPAGPAEEPA